MILVGIDANKTLQHCVSRFKSKVVIARELDAVIALGKMLDYEVLGYIHCEAEKRQVNYVFVLDKQDGKKKIQFQISFFGKEIVQMEMEMKNANEQFRTIIDNLWLKHYGYGEGNIKIWYKSPDIKIEYVKKGKSNKFLAKLIGLAKLYLCY